MGLDRTGDAGRASLPQDNGMAPPMAAKMSTSSVTSQGTMSRFIQPVLNLFRRNGSNVNEAMETPATSKDVVVKPEPQLEEQKKAVVSPLSKDTQTASPNSRGSLSPKAQHMPKRKSARRKRNRPKNEANVGMQWPVQQSTPSKHGIDAQRQKGKGAKNAIKNDARQQRQTDRTGGKRVNSRWTMRSNAPVFEPNMMSPCLASEMRADAPEFRPIFSTPKGPGKGWNPTFPDPKDYLMPHKLTKTDELEIEERTLVWRVADVNTEEIVSPPFWIAGVTARLLVSYDEKGLCFVTLQCESKTKMKFELAVNGKRSGAKVCLGKKFTTTIKVEEGPQRIAFQALLMMS